MISHRGEPSSHHLINLTLQDSPPPTTPEILDCTRFRDLLDHRSKGTKKRTFMKDCDNVLVRPAKAKDFGSDQWFSACYLAALQLIADESIARSLVLAICYEAHRLAKVKTVEEDTIPVVNELYDDDEELYIITSRGPALIEATERQLRDVGFPFPTESEPERNLPYAGTDGRRPVYRNRVIYCDGVPKGICTELFFGIEGLRIRRIIAIDDTRKHLVDIGNTVTAAGGEFVGLHYTRLLPRAKQFDMLLSTQTLLTQHHHFSLYAQSAVRRLAGPLGIEQHKPKLTIRSNSAPF